jgi:transposase InsO family protein
MKGKPERKPSGAHPFDRICAASNIEHRLTKPFHLQTNGMVERFNRRIAQVPREQPACGKNSGKNKFKTHAARNSFLNGFVDDYNKTRLRCLNYTAPLALLHNLAEENTCAGAGCAGAPMQNLSHSASFH